MQEGFEVRQRLYSFLSDIIFLRQKVVRVSGPRTVLGWRFVRIHQCVPEGGATCYVRDRAGYEVSFRIASPLQQRVGATLDADGSVKNIM